MGHGSREVRFLGPTTASSVTVTVNAHGHSNEASDATI